MNSTIKFSECKTHSATIDNAQIVESGAERAIVLFMRVGDAKLETAIRYSSSVERLQRAGQQQLAELCLACGHRGPLNGAQELIGKSVALTLERKNDRLEIVKVEAGSHLDVRVEWPAIIEVNDP